MGSVETGEANAPPRPFLTHPHATLPCGLAGQPGTGGGGRGLAARCRGFGQDEMGGEVGVHSARTRWTASDPKRTSRLASAARCGVWIGVEKGPRERGDRRRIGWAPRCQTERQDRQPLGQDGCVRRVNGSDQGHAVRFALTRELLEASPDMPLDRESRCGTIHFAL